MTEFVSPPDICDKCGERAHVIDSRSLNWWRRRRLECWTCSDEDGQPYRWTSYESRVQPRHVVIGMTRTVEEKAR